MTVKSCEEGATRSEVELEIGQDQYKTLLKLADTSYEKKRFMVPYNVDPLTNDAESYWEIDVFPDGLTIAEMEVFDFEFNRSNLPSWIGEEVTDKKEYYNAELSKRYDSNE